LQVIKEHRLVDADRTSQAELVTQEAPAHQGREARLWRLVFFALVLGLALLVLLRPLFLPIEERGDHYVYLSQSLVRGDLTIDNLPSSYPDYVVWQGHKYLPLGLLPGVVLVPFLPLYNSGLITDLAWIGHLFTILNGWLFWRVLGLAGIEGERRNWSLLLFFGGTVYFSAVAIGTSWFFAHVVATTFLLAAIWEALGRKRLWLVGLFLGLAGATRLTTLFALPFFLWLLWRRRMPTQSEDSSEAAVEGTGTPRALPALAMIAVPLLAGLVVPLAMVAAYNYLRFGNPIESGYKHAVLQYPVLAEALQHGLFSLVHVPKNLFMMLLQGPLPYPSADAPVLQFPYVVPSPWGMGLFFTSPALLYAFRAGRSSLMIACWLAVASIMVPVVTYYGIGWVQFGFRYALDFIPFLALLAALGLSASPSRLSKALITLSVLVNVWGVLFLILYV
jgi:hypothetical protein